MSKAKIYIGLSNPKSPDNVNSVKRAAGNFSADGIFYSGTRYPRALQLNPATVNMSRDISLNIPVNGVSELFDVVSENMKFVCIEFAEGAIALPEYQHPEQAFYIFGPEDGNLTQAIIDQADAVVYVPTQGCMNLAATVNVVLYDRLMKSSQAASAQTDANKLIRNSRDKNNNLKVHKADCFMMTQTKLLQQPEWVRWAAQDADGTWWGFEVEPLQNHQGWYENEVGQYIKISDGEPNPHWQKSLLRRQ